MKRFLGALAIVFCSLTAAFAQNPPVKQTGNVTFGHPAMWTTNGVIQDAGPAVQGFLTGVGVIAQGPGICQVTGPQSGPYQQLCLSVQKTGPAQIILQNFGGAPAETLQYVINGTVIPITGGGGGGSIFVGATPVVGGTSGDCLTNNSGVVGNVSCGGGGIGVNILSFGADPTGSADSTAAIQAAIDFTFNNKPARLVYCPPGNYKVSLPLWLDPPGSMRGPDGTHGHAYSGSDTYSLNDMVNSGGIAYIAIQNNFNVVPPNASFWRPLNWDATHTYATGDLVSYQGQIWKSQQNSNLNNTPSLGAGQIGPPGLPWQVFWNNQLLQFNSSTTFWGEPGLGNVGNGQGCTIKYTYANGPGIVIGAIDGNLLANVTLTGLGFTYRGLLPGNGIGVAIAGGGGGAAHTKVENVEIDNFFVGTETGFNQDQLGEENTWDKIVIGNCFIGYLINNTQNYINSIYESGANCTQPVVSFQGPSLNIFGGDWSPIPTKQNIFTMGSTGVTASGIPGGTQFTITTTLSGGVAPTSGFNCAGGISECNGIIGPANTCGAGGPTTGDCYINNCISQNPNATGGCVYSAWIIRLPGWGTVPMTMTAYDFNTHAATFAIDPGWSISQGLNNAMSGCPGSCATDFMAEIQANTSIYAVEMAVMFTSSNISINGIDIEPSTGACIQFGFNFNGGHNVGSMFRAQNILFQYNIGGGDFSSNNPADPPYGIFLCQESKPFMRGGFSSVTFSDNSMSNSIDPVVLEIPQLPLRCIFNNQGAPLINVVHHQLAQGSLCDFMQPPIGHLNLSGVSAPEDVNAYMTVGMHGWVPTPWSHPRLTENAWSVLQTITGGTSFGTYPYIYGQVVYEVGDYSSTSIKMVRSNHMFASFGRDITTSDNASLSWSYKGGTNIVNMDVNSLNFMTPGMVIGLDNGSGNQYYFVEAVYPHNSLDGGTHAGHVRVFGPVPSNASPGKLSSIFPGGNPVLAGTAGPTPTTYTCPGSCPVTKIAQQPYSWQAVSVTEPIGTPTVSACGTGFSLDSGSTNFSGAFTTGSSGTPTACTVTFSAAYPNFASCTVTPANAAANGVSGGTYKSAQSTAAFTITLGTGTNSAKYSYVCGGN